MKSCYDIIIRPLITEKTMKLVEGRQYTFEVKQGCNKIEVKNAVKEAFNVKVEAVRMINTRRKERRVGKYTGLRPAVQKAIVKLADGYKIEAFEL